MKIWPLSLNEKHIDKIGFKKLNALRKDRVIEKRLCGLFYTKHKRLGATM